MIFSLLTTAEHTSFPVNPSQVPALLVRHTTFIKPQSLKQQNDLFALDDLCLWILRSFILSEF